MTTTNRTARHLATPSTRWYNRFLVAYKSRGGWAGPATLRAIDGFVVELYRAGATAAAAGLAAAIQNRLHSVYVGA